MSKRDESPTLWICRGCCCGTSKHSEVDHEGQLARLKDSVASVAGARLIVVDCVDECAKSNVVVIRDRQRGRRKDNWLGKVLRTEETEALATWVQAPDRSQLPAVLERLRFSPTSSAELPHPKKKTVEKP